MKPSEKIKKMVLQIAMTDGSLSPTDCTFIAIMEVLDEMSDSITTE